MLRLAAGLLMLALGLSLGIGDVFLEVWRAGAQAQHDIAARGPFLLGMLVPYLGSAVVLLCIAAAVWLPWRSRLKLAMRLAVALLCAMAIVLLLYFDPLASAWRLLVPLRTAIGITGSMMVDTAITLIALWLVLDPERDREKLVTRAV